MQKHFYQRLSGPMVAADFQSILAALLLLERLPNGRYPNRNPAQAAWLLPMAEAIRQTVITVAVDRDIDVVATNSVTDHQSAAPSCLGRLGRGATERVIDPGISIVVTERLSVNGQLSIDCGNAITRWYGS